MRIIVWPPDLLRYYASLRREFLYSCNKDGLWNVFCYGTEVRAGMEIHYATGEG
jgi:hypothetical protein